MPILDLFKRKKKPAKPQKIVKPKTKPKVAVKPKAKLKKKGEVRKESKAYKILIKPIISEKATDLGAQNKYVFKVALSATKQEIRKAICDIYGITPISVDTVCVLGKERRYGRTKGKTSNWKKAIITVKPGEKIEIVEGV